MSSAFEPVDLGRPDQLQLAVRIGLAWIEIRRGASASVLRDYLFGTAQDALDQGQSDTLDLLVTRPAWRMSELAEALRVDPSTATRAIQRLVNEGLATRRACSEDGRVVNVSVSKTGKRQYAEVAKRRRVLLTHLLGSYSPDERVQLADMLERFVASIDDFVEQLPDGSAEPGRPNQRTAPITN
jgi:DNA-binding MarR family transcriptional regulator